MLFAIQQPTLPIARQLAIYILWFHIGLYIVVAPILILVNLVTLFVPPWYDAFFFTTRFFFFVRSNPERANSTRRSFITISCWAIVVFFHALVTLVIITIIKFITGGGNPKRDEDDISIMTFRKPRTNSNKEEKGD